MAYRKLLNCFLLLCLLLPLCCHAQKDSFFLDRINIPERYKFLHSIFEDAKNSIRKNRFDTIDSKVVLVTQSEESYKPYEGKIIRNIIIKRFDFERTFSDTASRIEYFGTQFLNLLHTDTRKFVIKNNVFIRKNTPLNPYMVADNERFLRNLNFIQDARILVVPADLMNDSVDVIIITKDLFSIKAIVDVSGFDLNSIRTRISESNLGGTAQSIQFTGLLQRNRMPASGFEVVYGKNNIGGSFVNGTVGYTNINTGRSDGNEEEAAVYFRMERPLVSPYSQLAGAMEISFNQSQNVYRKPDSLFYNYRYNLYDVWGGINLGVKDIREGISSSLKRDRTFLSARFLKTDYLKKPIQVGERIDPIYNNKQLVLAQATFFRQEYYKMNYLYGFGTTEDIPTGYNIAVTAGWHRQQILNRPYGGFEIDKYFVGKKGSFLHNTLKAGAFYRSDALEDASLLAAINYFTPLYPIKTWKIRQQIRANYTQLNNRVTYFPLYLNNAYGPPNFTSNSVFGDKRVSAYTESVLYLNKKVFGFLFAPFAYIAASTLTPEGKKFFDFDLYTSVGGGVRTRNENLIFGTIEFKALYFTKKVPGLQGFQFMINSDIRFRYRTNFVKAPDVIQLNFEDIY